MEFGDNKVDYNIFEAMKHPIGNHSIFYLDINLHSKFPNFDDFTDYDCTYTGLNECLIWAKISSVINASVGVVDITGADIIGVVEVVAIQPPLSSIKPPKNVALELLRWIGLPQATTDRSESAKVQFDYRNDGDIDSESPYEETSTFESEGYYLYAALIGLFLEDSSPDYKAL
ncbi:hypothetical protein CR513_41989, partial [Mucuna pruriens]